MLVVSAAGVSGTNIWVEEKMPDLMPKLKLRESLFERLLSFRTLGIPMLNIYLSAQWQCHQTLQLTGEKLGSLSCAPDVVKVLLVSFAKHGGA